MQRKISIKKNIILYDENSINQDIEEILSSRLEDGDLEKTIDDLYDPYLLSDMRKAVNRIKQAKENDEKIMIFWDYDVDWATSTSILMHFFKKLWFKSSYRLPHRIHDWYGLKDYFIDELKELWVSLIITVDCWTKDIDVIKYAKSLWIDVIVTDHHAVPDIIPEEAIAIINPKRKDCNYPFKWLAWAWVAYKLMMALALEYLPENEYRDYLLDSIDICAIWTVADCMSLTSENRIIVMEWLKQLKKSRSKWIRKIIEDKIHEDLDWDIFWFTIWPRLNAAWRMDTPYKAVNLILNNADSVYETVAEIELLNEKRKSLSKDFTEDALKNINRNDNIIFYVSKSIEHWIIWIIAWKITEQLHRPSIVLKDEWDKLVASCRSPDFFSIVDILEKYKDYFIAFGWHKQAAWFSISKEKFSDFSEKILEEVNNLDFSDRKKEIVIDKIVTLDELWFSFLSKINRYKPYWIGNLKPLFMIENIEYTKVSFLWQGRDHIKFDTKHWFKIFWFSIWEYLDDIRKANSIDIIFDLNEDSWMWKKNLMLKIIDIVIN